MTKSILSVDHHDQFNSPRVIIERQSVDTWKGLTHSAVPVIR